MPPSTVPMSARADELLAEADLLDIDGADESVADPMWRKRMNQQAWHRTRGRPNWPSGSSPSK